MKTGLRCALGITAGFAGTMVVVIAVEFLGARRQGRSVGSGIQAPRWGLSAQLLRQRE